MFLNKTHNQVEINLFNLQGQKVYYTRTTTQNNTVNLELSNFVAGIYFVEVVFGNKAQAQRIVVE